MTVKQITEQEKDLFNKLATHPLQSWEWGEFRKSQGHKVIRLGVTQKNQLKEVFQITFHKIPLAHLVLLCPSCPSTVGYLPKSPFPDKWVLEKLKEIGKEQKAIFIKIEPNAQKSEVRSTKFETLGLTKGKPLFTKYTSVIDLTRSEEEIFKSFKPKTRYNIRLAEKHGIVIKEDNSDKAFEEYLNLLFETTRRQGFYAHNKEFHRRQWQILQPAGISHLLAATYGAPQSGAESREASAKWDKGQILAAFLLFVFNQVLYYPYGASTREHKELMAPTLLMWEAIKFGKSRGCKSFDLWGDLEPNPPPNHPYFGFHRFKEGFSPKLVEFVGSYDLVINPTLYKIYQLTDKIRWGILHLKSKLIY